MDIYNQLINLFKTNDKTLQIFFNLRSRLCARHGAILIICEKKSDAIMQREFLKDIRSVYVKSINELENDTLDGYRFKKIIFY